MNDAIIKNYAIWARRELIEGVKLQMTRWAIDEECSVPASADTLHGEPLSAQQRTQRAELLEMCRNEGADALAQRAAYIWFNRLAAIRFMELHDYLPCGMRVLSAVDGSFDSQALREALHVDIEGLDRAVMAKLVQAGEREPQFRYILLCQCNELASCMPAIFERIGGAMELLLPGELLREGSVAERMVSDIPEDMWNDVEILGWMYQFYNAELKDEFFKSKRKAAQKDLAPATQLFTPNWIVRYMVENSLGRLWMLNNPDSNLRNRMDYYIEPDGDHEDFIRIKSPEEITFCDPACGSGHILVYAFSLLFEMYLERGYREREIPELILTKNLSGLEIDERAAQIAVLALAMCAREHDRRFFTRDVMVDVRVLKPVVFGKKDKDAQEERPVPRALGKNKELVEALAHLDEIGSLFVPSVSDMAALDDALAETPEGDLFAQDVRAHLELAKEQCEALARAFDVVVANPPYMGNSSFNSFMSKWIKANYADFKSDLFSAFISRIGVFCKHNGEVGIMSPFVWMFIGSYEKLRNKLIDEKTLTSLIQLEYSGFAGATVPICTFTYHNSCIDGYKGGYVRLSDFVGANVQAPKALEAIQNPDCGWFYRADAATFHDIPGSPIAYWASKAVRHAFSCAEKLGDIVIPSAGFQSGAADKFMFRWWESSVRRISFVSKSREDALSSEKKFFPCKKGGDFRKWYGNMDWVVNWENDGEAMRNNPGSVVRNPDFYFLESITWTKLSSSKLGMRFAPQGMAFDQAGSTITG
ncbi:MAG: BREX-1 system adenine-specific DNA-methyltransferase PglX, partial [Slackia sp.]|nr:BREX-1 system adenine-specific DNA-methyltransferase PglX [Slackia sp.]